MSTWVYLLSRRQTKVTAAISWKENQLMFDYLYGISPIIVCLKFFLRSVVRIL